MKRMMCLWFPNWPIQRIEARRTPPTPGTVTVLFAPRGEASRLLGVGGLRGTFVVTACSSAAAGGGVRPGLPLGEAESLLAGSPARFARHKPDADRARLRTLVGVCRRYTPIVALEDAVAPECLLLEVGGSAHLFGGERALAAKARRHLRRIGYHAHAAVADGVGAAWALAHAQPEGCIPPGENASVIPDLDVELLRLPTAAIHRLHQFDLRQIRQVMALPRSDLGARFGPETLVRLDQALGLFPETIVPEPYVEPVEATWEFEDPVAHPDVVENVLERLLERIVPIAAGRHVGVQRVDCALETADRATTEFSVGLLHPVVSVERLGELLRLRLERVRLPAEVIRIAVRARVAPIETRQPRWFESEDAPERQAACRDFVERLSNRLGDDAVLRPRLRPEEQPEFAWDYVPWLADQGDRDGLRDGTSEEPRRLTSPIELLEMPLAVHVEAGPEGPRRLAWRQHRYEIVRVWGPHRIETGWWRGQDVRRDYYRVATHTGERFWLFQDRRQGDWRLHGLFA